MSKGKIWVMSLAIASAILFMCGSAFAVTVEDVIRLKQKAANGEMFSPAEQQLAADAQREFGSKIEWPQQSSSPRRPRNPLDVYIAVDVDYEWIDITEVGSIAGIENDDQTVGPFDLGFDFTYFDETYTSVFMTSNGWSSFQDQGGWSRYWNEPLPDFVEPHACQYIFWDDLYPPAGGEYYYYADEENQRFIMSWINVPHISANDEQHTFQIVLTPDGNIRYNYQFVADGQIGNTSCGSGIENQTSDDGIGICNDGGGAPPVSETSILIGQPDGVPLPVTGLTAVVTDHDVALTWIDPAEDTNGNPITLTNIQVWSGSPSEGTLLATVAAGVESALITNMNDGSRTIYVRAFADPYYGGADRENIIVGTPSYANDFDDNNGQWTSELGWVWGAPVNPNVPGVFSAPNAWGTDSEFGVSPLADYSLELDLGLTISNPDAALEFYCYFDNEFFWDGCNLKVSIDDGETWTIALPDGGYPVEFLNTGAQNPIEGEPAWSGMSTGWIHVNVPLAEFVGQVPIFRFHYGSASFTSGYPGFYIDDLIIWGLAEPVLSFVSGTISLDGGNGTMTNVVVQADGFGRPSTNPDANGAYTINNVLIGNRRIRATLAGYHPASVLVPAQEGGLIEVDLTLTRLDPPAPVNLTGTVNSTTGLVTLNWDDSADPLVDIYTIYARLAGDQDFVQTGTSVASTFQQTLVNDGIYQYVVTATDNDVAIPVVSERSNQATVLFGELPVTQLGADGNYDDRIRLSWLTPGIIEGTELFYDDGSAEQFYVVEFPAGPSNYFCVRMTPPDDAGFPLMIYSVAVFVQNQEVIPWIGICPPLENGGADIANAFYEWTDLASETTPGWVMAETDGSVFMDAPGDFYIAYQFPPGADNQPGVGSDQDDVDDRSYWTQDPANFWNLWQAHDWMMRAWLGGPPPEGGVASAQDFYMVSTGTPTGYAMDRVSTLLTVGTISNPNVITIKDKDNRIARGPVVEQNTPVNTLDNWFAPYINAPEVQLISRTPRETLDDIVNYRVYRGGTMIAEPVATNYVDLNRVENTPYSYHVTAMYDNGIESPASPTRVARCNMAPAAPTNLDGIPVGNTQMALAWSAPTTNADGTPLVDLAQTKIYRNGTLIATVPPGTTTYTDTPPQNDGFYVWTVTSQDEVPNVSNPSGPFIGAVVSPFESIDYEWVDISGIGTEVVFDWWGAISGPYELGFNYPFLDTEYSQLWLSGSGWVTFLENFNGFIFSSNIPDGFEPHAAIYPFWDEFVVGLDGGRVMVYQDAAEDRFIISWLEIPSYWDFAAHYTFQLILEEGGAAIFNYQTIPTEGFPGNIDCTVGVEDATSTAGIPVYAFGEGTIAPVSESSIAFWAGPSGTITGLIREFGTNIALDSAIVTVDQVPDLVSISDATGLFLLEVEPGTYTLRIHIQGYCDQVVNNVVVVDEGTASQNFSLRQPSATFSVTSINLLSVTGQNATAEFEITNPGATCDLEYSISSNQNWLTVSSPTGSVVPNQSQLINVNCATANFTPGDYSATIMVSHNDHNSPLAIPVTISVTLSADDPAEIPTVFALHQNYPNPFNATTVLNFDVPQQSQVQIVLFNVQGQEVARPVDMVMAAGRHQINYEAQNLSTGMYLVKMTAGGFSAVQKIVLLK